MDLVNALNALPVAARLPEIVAAARGGAVVVTAPPGSGKTTLVAPALLDDLGTREGKVILVQPRRLAARAVARRIAALRHSPLGQEIGYHVRFDRRASAQTRLLVVTTGVLLRRLLDDESLEGVAAVVLDEFHERTIELDLALGMLCRIRETLRPDMRIAVMSATLDPRRVAHLLGNCPALHAEGRCYPVEIKYAHGADKRRIDQQVADAVRHVAAATSGHLLAFLPGVGEILRCRELLAAWAAAEGRELLPLYGDLPAGQQDRVLSPSDRPKVILATNVAETSLTIDGVTAVVDSGWARQLRFNPHRGLPRLELVPISQASADQRAGRAGRTRPGRCWRLWEQRTHRGRPESEPPEILRSDLSDTILRLRLWGERDATAFPWLDSPLVPAVAAAENLLRLLGALDDAGAPTPVGVQLARLPTHPRLGRLLMAAAEAGALREATIAAALLSERDPFATGQRSARGPRDRSTPQSRSDLADRVRALEQFHAGGRWSDPELDLDVGAARRVLQAADQLYREVEFSRGPRSAGPDEALRHALLAGFPDRLARLRPGAQERGLLVGGKGVRIDSASRVRGEPFFLAIDLRDADGEARARMASAVERSWLEGPCLRTVDELFFNPTRQQVEARRRNYWLDLLLDETPVAIEDAAAAAELLARQARLQLTRLLPDAKDAAVRLRARAAWLATAMPELGLPTLELAAIAEHLPLLCAGRRSIDELRRGPWLEFFQQLIGYERLAEIDRLAPAALTVPSGNRIALLYEPGRPPILAVRIQELFGLAETPRIAGGRAPVLLHLLGPNYRAQQVTDDLASFWRNAYPEVKKELRRRYPKHAWPDVPQAAAATRSGLNRDAQGER